jgi:hypothetical protein
MVIGGTRKLVNLHAPVLAAGVGGFLAQTQKSRTFSLEMEPYTEDTKPAREFSSEQEFSDLDAVYWYPRHWARKVKLDPKPAPPPGVIRRFGDNVRGLLAIADSADRSGDSTCVKRFYTPQSGGGCCGAAYTVALGMGARPITEHVIEAKVAISGGQGNESRLTRLWLERAESVQQVLRVPGGALAAALDRSLVGDLADQIEGEVAYYRHVFGTVTTAQA